MTSKADIEALEKTLKKLSEWKETFMTKHRSRFILFRDLKARMDDYTGVAHCDHGTIRSDHSALTIPFVRHVMGEMRSHGSYYLTPDDRFMVDNFRRIFQRRRGRLFQKKGLTDEEIGFIVRLINGHTDRSQKLDRAYHALLGEKELWERATDLEIQKGNELLTLARQSGDTEHYERFAQEVQELGRERDITYTLLNPQALREINPPINVTMTRRQFLGVALAGTLAAITVSSFALPEWRRYILTRLEKTVAGYSEKMRYARYYRSRNLLYGDTLYRSFAVPEFFRKDETIAKCAISIPFDEFYALVKGARHDETDMYHPSQRIQAFSRGMINLDRQMQAGKDIFNKDMLHPDYVTICSVLAFINRNIQYVSDSRYRTRDDGTRYVAPGREEHTPLYDRKDYYKYPEQTLIDAYGDCEDYSILAASLLMPLLKDARVGICWVSLKGPDHEILAVEVNIACAITIMNHHFTFEKSGHDPIMFMRGVPSRVDTAFRPGGSQRVLVLIEPQDYHTDAMTIDMTDTRKLSVSLDGRPYREIRNEYTRVFLDWTADGRVRVRGYGSMYG